MEMLERERFLYRAKLVLQERSPDHEVLAQIESTLRHFLESCEGDDTEGLHLLDLALQDAIAKQRQPQEQEEVEREETRRPLPAAPARQDPSPDDHVPLDSLGEHEASDNSSAEKVQSLLLLQRDLSTQALEEERKSHALLASEVASLTAVLKDATLLMNKAVLEQNVHLDSLELAAAENQSELDKQQSKTKAQTKTMVTSLWTTLGSVIWIVSLFVATFFVIRIFPKP